MAPKLDVVSLIKERRCDVGLPTKPTKRVQKKPRATRDENFFLAMCFFLV